MTIVKREPSQKHREKKYLHTQMTWEKKNKKGKTSQIFTSWQQQMTKI